MPIPQIEDDGLAAEVFSDHVGRVDGISAGQIHPDQTPNF
jgi:hypothetical protein